MKFFKFGLIAILALGTGLGCPGSNVHEDHGDHGDREGHEKHDSRRGEDSPVSEEHRHAEAGSADDDHGHGHEDESGGSVGPGKAVRAADETTGIELAPAAIARLNIQTTPLRSFQASSTTEFLIPQQALIRYEDKAEIFVQIGTRLRPTDVRVLAASGDHVRIKTNGSAAVAGWQDAALVTRNAPFVRLAYLEAFGASGSGHGH